MSSDGPSERMRKTLKSPYDEDGDFWTALFNAFSEEFEQYEDALDEIHSNKFIETADKAQLNRLASLFQTSQRQNESIEAFRARLKTELRKQTTSATVGEVREIVSVMLNISPDRIAINEPPTTDIATFAVQVPVSAIEDTTLSSTELNRLLNGVSAAGVNGVSRFVLDTAEMLVIGGSVQQRPMTETESASLTLSANAVVVSEMTEAGVADVTLITEDTENLLVYDIGLSSATLNPLSAGDWYDQIIRERLLDTAEMGLSASNVINRTIGPVTARLSLSLSDTIDETVFTDGLSSSTLNTLSGDNWTGVEVSSRAIDSAATALDVGDVIHETVGPVTARLSVSALDTEVALFEDLESAKLSLTASFANETTNTMGLSATNLNALSDGVWTI